ncbi:hypothetical protein GCM10009760_43280 [Kitasatospora kazusensis]|uniref:Uncharacterized protein n=1 Tax=Kitasatospora kazusensis TaxID=407974 RepID=A0ABN2ZXQ7_9ACTN
MQLGQYHATGLRPCRSPAAGDPAPPLAVAARTNGADAATRSSYVSTPTLPGNIPGQDYLVVHIHWHQWQAA